jgi:hypothetical protein
MSSRRDGRQQRCTQAQQEHKSTKQPRADCAAAAHGVRRAPSERSGNDGLHVLVQVMDAKCPALLRHGAASIRRVATFLPTTAHRSLAPRQVPPFVNLQPDGDRCADEGMCASMFLSALKQLMAHGTSGTEKSS